MSRPWDRGIRRLQRHIVLSGMVDALGRVLLPAVPVALAYLLATKSLPWTRFFAAYLGIVLLVVLIVTAIVGALASRRSELYCAKWIDVRNQLQDRLASSVEWSRLAAPDPFQQRCIEQFTLAVGARQVRLDLPSTRSPRLPVAVGCALALVAVAAVYVYRPASHIEQDARAKSTIPKTVAATVGKQVELLGQQASRIDDAELTRVSEELKTFLDVVDRGGTDRETTLRAIDKIRKQIAVANLRTSGLADLSKSGLTGPVGALADAIGRGDTKGAHEALEQVKTALAQGGLSEDEVTNLGPLLAGLASVAEPRSKLTEQLNEASRLAQNGNQPGAAKMLADASPQLGTLDRAIEARSALQRAEAALQKLQETLNPDPSAPAQKSTGPSEPTPNGKGTVSASSGRDAISAGDQTVEERVLEPLLPAASDGADVSIKGIWNGKVMRSLFDSTDATTEGEAAKRILVDHERVVEDRFARDDIPLEYEDAIRTYFAAVHQKGK